MRNYILLCLGLPVAAGFGLMHLVFARPALNPVIEPAHTVEARTGVTPAVESILNQACKDCHSSQTRWPWFSSIAPASWLIARDVERGRSAMNLSQWSAKPRVAMDTLAAACQSIQTGRMPPASYRWMHPEARLTNQQVSEFCGWTDREARALRDQLTRRIFKSARVPASYGPETQP
jgi:hypothetical protein